MIPVPQDEEYNGFFSFFPFFLFLKLKYNHVISPLPFSSLQPLSCPHSLLPLKFLLSFSLTVIVLHTGRGQGEQTDDRQTDTQTHTYIDITVACIWFGADHLIVDNQIGGRSLGETIFLLPALPSCLCLGTEPMRLSFPFHISKSAGAVVAQVYLGNHIVDTSWLK